MFCQYSFQLFFTKVPVYFSLKDWENVSVEKTHLLRSNDNEHSTKTMYH